MASDYLVCSMCALLALCGLFFVSSFLHVARRLRKETTQRYLASAQAGSFFYFALHRVVFGTSLDLLLFCLTCCQHILRIVYLFLLFLCATEFTDLRQHTLLFDIGEFFAYFCVAILTLLLFADIFPRVFAWHKGQKALRISAFFSAPFLLIFFPLTFILYRIMRLIPGGETALSPIGEPTSSKERLLDAIRDADEGNLLGDHDKKLLQSVFTFRDRIAREVMVPRVNLSCISLDSTLQEAALLFEKEEYSRVPVYKNSVDEIIGILMYKDLLLRYMRPDAKQEEPIEPLVKKIIYAPETKKISQLLQEFRKKQTHIAIVVDEYGGTAGVVTIEDILEELVGEIADEYDEEAALFKSSGKGVWIVDARMNILDLEEEIGIKIPQDGEYDTVAGYIFFRLQTIPPKGTTLHHDDFDLEILASNERVVEKVKISKIGT